MDRRRVFGWKVRLLTSLLRHMGRAGARLTGLWCAVPSHTDRGQPPPKLRCGDDTKGQSTTLRPVRHAGQTELRRSRISAERTIGAPRNTSTKPTRRELPGNLLERVAGCRSELLASALPAQVTVYSHSVYNSVDNRRTMAAGRDPVTDVPPCLLYTSPSPRD